jgi:transposase
MSKSYRPWIPRQAFLLPPSPLDWLPKDHFVYFLLDVLEELNLRAIEDVIQEKDGRGNRPFDPRMMLSLVVYGYCVGIRSSRKLEQATHTDVAFRVLTSGENPDHSAIAEFRRLHRTAMEGLFLQVLHLCQAAGLVKLGHVALDGTKLEANASMHKAMSHSRMKKTKSRLENEVKQILDDAERIDREEDALYGVGNRGDALPAELTRREDRLKKIREVMAALEAEAARTRAQDLREREQTAKAQAEKAGAKEREKKARHAAAAEGKAKAAAERARDLAKKREESAAAEVERTSVAGTAAQHVAAQREHQAATVDLAKALREDLGALASTELPEHRVNAIASGDPHPSAQRNFTDPDSRIQKTGKGFVQGYNAQAAVDEGHQIIVACALTNQPPDVEHLPAMLGKIEQNCGTLPVAMTADAGYWSADNVRCCTERGVDPHISVHRDRHGATPPSIAKTQPMEEMRAKLQTPDGKALYARRKATVEPVFGQIKECRGFRRLLLRGLLGARAEWQLACTAHNLLKLFRAVGADRVALAAATG